MKQYFVYILTSHKNGTLYIGVTSDLAKRVYQHKNNAVEGFTEKYNVHKLAYFDVYEDIENAIKREKRLKKYRREAKVKLIETENPEWRDLYHDIC